VEQRIEIGLRLSNETHWVCEVVNPGTDAFWDFSFDQVSGMAESAVAKAVDGCIVHCGIISSCQSAATSEILKCFWL